MITWLLVTVSEASLAHASVMVMPNASSAATVVTAGGAIPAEQPCRLDTGIVPAMTGGELSITCITCEAVDEFEHPSVAVHVRVTVYVPAQLPATVWSVEVSVKALPHASVAVATAKFGAAGQLIVDGAGNAAMTGAVISCTWMT